MQGKKIRAAIIGASGYTGVELMRLIATHPGVDFVWAAADTMAGQKVSDLYPSLAAQYRDVSFESADSDGLLNRCDGVDVIFLGLPHEASLQIAPSLVGRVPCVVDLSAAFRLSNASQYQQWYGFTHHRPELLRTSVYGLPELHRDALSRAELIATPGCYVTAATLALAPLVRLGIITTSGVIVDAASGVSGAGRVPKQSTHFNTVNEDMNAYGLLDHRHTPEMEEQIGAEILFTPHLVPMNRGILATCYARPSDGSTTTRDVLEALRDFYDGEPFVVVTDQSPSTKATLGSNSVHMTARVDQRTGHVVVVSALDNLCKGASGGAIQAMNVAFGFDEEAGLTRSGLYP